MISMSRCSVCGGGNLAYDSTTGATICRDCQDRLKLSVAMQGGDVRAVAQVVSEAMRIRAEGQKEENKKLVVIISIIAAVAGVVLLLASLILAPILVYVLGIPWLPSIPQASTSQLALVYAIYSPLISIVGGLLVNKYLLQRPKSNSGQTMPKPQSRQITHDDPIVIGGGREENYWLCVSSIFLSMLLIAGIIYLTPPTDTNNKLIIIIMLVVTLLIIVVIISLNYGTRRECLKIGSDGIVYSGAKDRLFIPWNEVSSAYVDQSIFFDKLCVKLISNSRLHFQEPIKLRHNRGVIVICGVSSLAGSTLPKHLVESALDVYRP